MQDIQHKKKYLKYCLAVFELYHFFKRALSFFNRRNRSLLTRNNILIENSNIINIFHPKSFGTLITNQNYTNYFLEECL